MSAFLLSTDIVSITAYVRKVNLSTETQTQIAQILAALLRRVQAIPDTPGTGVGRADQLERR